MKYRIGIILVLTGMLVICSAFWMRSNSEQKEKAMIEEFNHAVAEEYDDEEHIVHVQPDEMPEIPENMIGIMTIHKIGLTVPLVDGVDTKSLKYAVGHFAGTPMPGDMGNCAVAGHRSYTYNQHFNRLDELEAGDMVTVRTRKGEYAYTVFEKKIVEPTDLSVLKNTDEPIITLITCHPERSSAYRLIVKGRLD